MIVKNEAHCIKSSLESIKPYISSWVICDTGSTDSTEEIVFQTLKDIPGKFHHQPWVDFSHNRNLALNLSKKEAPYSLIMDADDILIVNDPSQLQNLTHFAYAINIHHSKTIYPRTQIIHNSIHSKFIGVIHEYLEINCQSILLNDCYIKYTGIGNRSKNPNKYLDDAIILENEFKKTNNPRDAFYCAQSYRDFGNFDKALEYYVIRINLGGWQEEVYQSFLNVGKIVEHQKSNFLTVTNSYIKAINCNPNRIEGYYYLAKYCREHKYYDLAYFYSKLGSQLQKPIGGLFMESDCYDWKIFDELAISAFWIGKISESRNKNILLLENKFVPEFEKFRIRENLKFCF